MLTGLEISMTGGRLLGSPSVLVQQWSDGVERSSQMLLFLAQKQNMLQQLSLHRSVFGWNDFSVKLTQKLIMQFLFIVATKVQSSQHQIQCSCVNETYWGTSFCSWESSWTINKANVRTRGQIADIFTKTLAKTKFQDLREALGLIDCKHALRGVSKFSASFFNYLLVCFYCFVGGRRV